LKLSKIVRLSKRLKIVALLICIFLPSILFASFEFDTSVSFGLKWNSNVEFYYTKNRLNSLSLVDDQVVRNDISEKSTLFITNDLSAAASNKSFRFSYSASSDTSPKDMEYSSLNQSVEFSYNHYLTERVLVDISSTAHHLMEDYENLRNVYLDAYFYTSVFYDFNDYSSFFIGIKAGYYKKLSNLVKYLTGPLAGFEFGAYIHPTAKESFIKVSLGSDFFIFNNETFEIEKINRSLKTHNSYYKLFADIAPTIYLSNSFSVNMKFTYFFLKWYDRDFGVNYSWIKRRLEHTASSSISCTYNIHKKVDLTIYYSFKKTWSTFGTDRTDYVDYNQQNHTGGTSFIFIF